MTIERPLDDARRLEALLIAVRWIVAAFGAAQVGLAVRDSGADRSFALALGSALVIGLLVGNLLLSRALKEANDARPTPATGATMRFFRPRAFARAASSATDQAAATEAG